MKGGFGRWTDLDGFEARGMTAVLAVDAHSSRQVTVCGENKAVTFDMEELTNATTEHKLGGSRH